MLQWRLSNCWELLIKYPWLGSQMDTCRACACWVCSKGDWTSLLFTPPPPVIRTIWRSVKICCRLGLWGRFQSPTENFREEHQLDYLRPFQGKHKQCVSAVSFLLVPPHARRAQRCFSVTFGLSLASSFAWWGFPYIFSSCPVFGGAFHRFLPATKFQRDSLRQVLRYLSLWSPSCCPGTQSESTAL